MARHKEFDKAKVLSKAMEFFWYRGYEGTSLQELLKHLGIAKQSMYDTYGNKHDLFLASLKHYADQKITFLNDALERYDSPKKSIKAVFYDLVKFLIDEERKKGCFMINTAVELAPHDQEISRLVETNMEHEVSAFYQALIRAQKEGELSERHDDLMALARFLNQARYSLFIASKSTSNPVVLNDIVKITLSVLD
ncbi:putative HTH-type transcriptional regulator YezE [Siminovitchia terrae]|uniref:HTH-type transcriptional regulator YezE n=1 Tax=Siminovitchia terrae TaxID=1914933 RepID=A0ABQ4KY48_SIMTE|nr:TetR/AcrR family transcriptional regulator [Siminovitchia terrae]GIN96961.1 putative HTH-type transcriptional regulator YezE [Siminovitchia terrae]